MSKGKKKPAIPASLRQPFLVTVMLEGCDAMLAKLSAALVPSTNDAQLRKALVDLRAAMAELRAL